MSEPENTHFAVPVETMNKVVAILSSLPFAQVAQVMSELNGVQGIHLDA